jgi:hypothetical protein
MTEEQIALAKRAVACKGWRWMPGALVCVPGDRGHITAVFDGDEGVTVYVSFDEETPSCRFEEEIGLLLPDLTDPATLGCLLALVREAWGDLHMVARCDDRHGKVSWWICRWGDLPRSRECSTEAEALVAALEAAP